MNENGAIVARGQADAGDLTDAISGKATDHIRSWPQAGDPFFLYVAPFNICRPYVPAPRHAGSGRDAAPPRPPAFTEEDAADKPAQDRCASDARRVPGRQYHRELPGPPRVAEIVRNLVEAIVPTFDETGEFLKTYIVYAPDNGFHLSLRRMMEGKDTAHEEDIRAPLFIFGPGITPGTTVDAMALSIDPAPTFAGMAGTVPADPVDGRSVLLGHGDGWGRSVLVQRQGLKADERLRFAHAVALRTDTRTYVGWTDGEHEANDHATDPDRRGNAYGALAPATTSALWDLLIKVRAGAAQAGRSLENATPPAP